MEIRQYISLLGRWLWLILLGMIIAGSTAFFISRSQTPLYRATSILLVSEGTADSNEYRALLVGEQLAQSYTQRLINHDVLAQAIENLNLNITPEALKEQTNVNLLNETQLLSLSVAHPNPQIASDLANEIPAVFALRNLKQQQERFAASKASLEAELAELEEELAVAESALKEERQKSPQNDTTVDQASTNLLRLRDTYSRILQSYETLRMAEASSLNTIIIDEYARPPQQPISPNLFQNTLLATVVGGMLALGIVFLVEYLDDTIKNPGRLEQITNLSILGNIEELDISKPVDGLVVAMAPRSPAAEAFRHIRTNIQFVRVNRELKSILIASANAGEGKSTVATNLATALAQSGKRVIVVDADLRRPNLHTLLEVSGQRGLTDLIIRGREDESFLKSTLIPNLRLLPAGRIPPNPAELLGSERMQDVLAWLETQGDYVILDSPPILAVTDGVVLSRVANTTLVVVGPQTRQPEFEAAIQQIAGVDSHIAGVVMNKIRPRNRLLGYNYYYYPRQYYHQNARQAPYQDADTTMSSSPSTNGHRPPQIERETG